MSQSLFPSTLLLGYLISLLLVETSRMVRTKALRFLNSSKPMVFRTSYSPVPCEDDESDEFIKDSPHCEQYLAFSRVLLPHRMQNMVGKSLSNVMAGNQLRSPSFPPFFVCVCFFVCFLPFLVCVLLFLFVHLFSIF